MSIIQEVQHVWTGLRVKVRCEFSDGAMRAPKAELRTRCKIVRYLAQGRRPSQVLRALECSESSLYRVADRFIAAGYAGLCDRRETNGEVKVHEAYVPKVFAAVEDCSQEHGYDRTTWTQETLVLFAQAQTGVRISCSTMSRLLRRCDMRRGHPKPIVNSSRRERARTRRLNALRRLEENLPRARAGRRCCTWTKLTST